MHFESLEGRQLFISTFSNSIAGFTFRCKITDGSGNFAKVGVFELMPATSGDSYTLRNVVGVRNSGGQYVFERTSSKVGRIIFQDRLLGVGTGDFALTGDNKGSYVLNSTQGQGSSEGTFSLTVPIPTTGSVSGTVFLDRNRNTVLDRRDTVYPNVQVFLDANGDGFRQSSEASAFTSTTGAYTFSSVKPGTYRIATATPTGTLINTPLRPIRVLAGGTYKADRGFATAATISGSVFRDVNGNHRKDTNESFLSGYRVFIDANGNGIFDRKETSVVSSTNGSWLLQTLDLAATVRVSGVAVSYTASLKNGRTLAGISFGIPVS